MGALGTYKYYKSVAFDSIVVSAKLLDTFFNFRLCCLFCNSPEHFNLSHAKVIKLSHILWIHVEYSNSSLHTQIVDAKDYDDIIYIFK